MPSQRAKKLNLNTATEEELQALPGVGRITARRIIASRQSGSFKQVSDLLRVRGFSQALYDQVASHVFVEAGPGRTDPTLRTFSFGTRRTRGTRKAIEPINFYGTPRQLTGVVPLANTGEQSTRLTAIQLENAELHAPSGAIMTEIPVRRQLEPGEQVSAPLSVAVDHRTPPGTYRAEFVLGDQRQPVIFHIAEVIKLKVVPERLVIGNNPGSKVLKTLFVTNLGNVNIELGDIGVVGLEQTDLICHTIRETVNQVKDPDWDTTVASFVNTLNKSFQESRALTVRTQGKPVRISPGETVSVELSITLPSSLRRRRRYFGSMRLYNVSIPILVQPMAASAETEQPD